LGGGAGSPCNTMWPRLTFVPSGILIHAAVWPQQSRAEIWGRRLCLLFEEGELGPHLTQYRLGRGPPGILIRRAIWPQQIWAENLGLCPFGGGGSGSSSNTVARAESYLHSEFHLDPSNRLATIHQRHRQDRQTTVR